MAGSGLLLGCSGRPWAVRCCSRLLWECTCANTHLAVLVAVAAVAAVGTPTCSPAYLLWLLWLLWLAGWLAGAPVWLTSCAQPHVYVYICMPWGPQGCQRCHGCHMWPQHSQVCVCTSALPDVAQSSPGDSNATCAPSTASCVFAKP